MDLKNFLPGSDKDNEKEYYWSLIIEPGWVQAGVWNIEDDKAEVVSISPAVAWEEEELLNSVDAALSAAIQNLPEDMGEPTKTVFGVNPSWVAEGNIKDEYLEKIRKICSSLSLKPAGFVVLPEAISHLTKAQEGAPLNACVLGIGKDALEIALFRLGNLVGASQIARSVSIVDDVAEGLARFAGSEAFPSRILLYNGKEGELEEVKQALLNVSWESFEKIKFLHAPKIEIFSPERKVLAVSLAGASEIANVTGVATAKIVGGVGKTDEMEEENLKVPEEEVNPEELGFVLGEDVTKIPRVGQNLKTEPENLKPGLEPKEEQIPEPQKIENRRLKIPSFSLAFLKRFKLNIPRPKFLLPGKRIFIFGAGSLLVIIFLGILAWWFLPSATVTIYVSPQKLEEKTEVSVQPSADSLNFSEKIIPGKVLTTVVSGEKTKGTTGTKTVGEKSKGSVKIQNGTAASINLAAGTVISTNSDLKFVTDEAVSVSAAISPANPGTATVNITASTIGAEFNLAKDEIFDVGNYPRSDVDGVSTSDFTGGSSRQIAAVSEDDQKVLEEELHDELLSKAKEELSQKIDENETFIGESARSEITDKTFASKIGDETETLKLNLTMEVKGLSVSRKELTDLAMEILKNKVPSGYVLREGQIANEFDFLEEQENGTKVEVLFKANLLPEVKPEEIAAAIKGKYQKFAEDYLTSIRGFTRAVIVIKPKLPGKLRTLPRIGSRIDVVISAE